MTPAATAATSSGGITPPVGVGAVLPAAIGLSVDPRPVTASGRFSTSTAATAGPGQART